MEKAFPHWSIVEIIEPADELTHLRRMRELRTCTPQRIDWSGFDEVWALYNPGECPECGAKLPAPGKGEPR